MSVDDLRAGFARLAETVTPAADPYGRLVRRRRQRRRIRFAGLSGAVATVLAGALAGAPYLAGSWSARPPADGYPIDSDAVRLLLSSPTRGNLAGDHQFISDVRRVFDRDRDRVGADDSLPEATVLFAHEVGSTRTVAVAYHSDDRAAFLVASDRAGTSAAQLARAGGMGNVRVTPFLTFRDARGERPGEESTHFAVGLAPDGCEVSTSDSATVGVDGAVQRQWRAEPTGSYVVREGDYRTAARELWRVTCGGQARHQAPAQRVDELSGFPAPPAVDTGTARGTVDGAAAAAAVGSWERLAAAAGIPAGQPQVVWGGSIPEKGTEMPMVLVGPLTGRGPIVLQRGGGPEAMVALGGPEATGRPVEVETMAASRAGWSLAATGTAAGDLLAVRVPERDGGHAVLGERLLVVAPAAAVRVAAVTGGGTVVAEAPLADGVGILTVPVPANVTLRAFDGRGDAVASVPFAEPDGQLRLFGEPLLSDW